MAMSGVKVDPKCIDTFQLQKLGADGKKNIGYVCYRIDEQSIVVDHIVSKKGDQIPIKESKEEQVESVKSTPAQTEDLTSEQLKEIWQNFISSMPQDECRYYTYDFAYIQTSGQRNNKICFITWAPDTAKIKKKMLIASTKESIKKVLVGISTDIQASGADDLEYGDVLSKVMQQK